MPFERVVDPDALELDDEVLLLDAADELDVDEVLDVEAVFCLDDDELDEELLLASVCVSRWELEEDEAALWLDPPFVELDDEEAASEEELEVLLAAALLDGSVSEEEEEDELV